VTVRVCVVGAAGRLGSRVVQHVLSDAGCELASVLIRSSQPSLPEGVRVTSDANEAFSGCDAVIDFSAPAVAADVLSAAVAQKVAYVLASTGLEAADETAIDTAASNIAMLQAANTSLGVNVLLELVSVAAQRLPGFDVEINEIHHGKKRDAPSGTALALGAAAKKSRSNLRDVIGRSGKGEARAADELGYAALRGGDVAGEHTVFLFGANERIELIHRATTPDIFAAGALYAARWLVGQKPGRYTMADALKG